MGVPRGTTPTLLLTVDGVDLTGAANIYATFFSNNRKLTKLVSVSDVEYSDLKSQVPVTFTQAESLQCFGDMKVQLNWTYHDGSRSATDIARFEFTPQLLEQVVV